MHCRETILTLVINALAASFVAAATATPGDLDTGFGTNGKVTTSFGQYGDVANAVAVQPDGKIIVVGGSYQAATRTDFAIARYNTDGSLDTTFGTGGKTTTDFTGSQYDDSANAVAIQADGRIVVAGGAGPNFGICRYNSNGVLDTTFGSSGKATVDLWSGYDNAVALALQGDGKILVAGDSHYDLAVVRLNPNETLDSNFGNGGIVTTDFAGGTEIGYCMALQSDGKILVAGTSDPAGAPLNDYVFAIARYNTNGTLDANFGNSGKVTTPIGNNALAHAITLQGDGKILLAGMVGGVSFDFGLVRYNTNGSLDSTFGVNGIVATDFGEGTDERAQSVAVQQDGKIVVGGTFSPTGSNYVGDFALARYNADGSFDTSFAGTGHLTFPLGAGDDRSTSMCLQKDGKIVLAGYTANGTTNNFAIARFWAFPPHESWRLQYFGTTLNTGTAADMLDSDHDGLTNLLEYALGGAPTNGLNTPKYSFASESLGGINYLTVTITRPVGEESLVYALEVSPDLLQWNSGPSFTTILADSGTTLKIRDNVPLTPGNNRFGRIRVTAP